MDFLRRLELLYSAEGGVDVNDGVAGDLRVEWTGFTTVCSAWRVTVERESEHVDARFIFHWREPNGERFHIVGAPAFALRWVEPGYGGVPSGVFQS